MSKKNNAKYHLKVICPLCPKIRRQYRAIHKQSNCWWEDNWIKENYDIPRHFGVLNWTKAYLGISTNLEKYRNK